jgi:FKBP-type peptidyl-prolyl cis-trans isomerase FklB
VVREGQGPRAGDLDAVRLNYRGTLLDGNEFDGTDTGKPGTLKVLQAFNGLREVLKAMPAGSHWKVWIAPQLAYGERGVGSDIGPNELLCYDIELLAVLPGEGR